MKRTLIFCFLFISVWRVSAQYTTLRHFDPNSATYQFPSGYAMHVARFEPSTPGTILKIRVKTGGNMATGSMEMTMFGHEGGTAFPQLEKPLFPWVPMKKTAAGDEWIEYTLPNPWTSLNNQFFVAFRNLTNGIRIYADTKTAAASCKSSSGGDYYFIFLKTTSNTWALGNKYALAVEVEMKPLMTPGAPYFKNTTGTLGIDSTIGNGLMCWADLNGDGYQDLLTHTRLYMNDAGKGFRDETKAAGYAGTSAGALFIDLDNDGDLDILTLPAGDSAMFYRNDGQTRLTRIKTSGLKPLPCLSSFSAGDIDKDGFPDLFTGQLWGAYPEPWPNYLFKNNGDGTFTDITQKLYPKYNGVSNYSDKVTCKASDQATWLSGGNTNRRSRGSAFVDYDNDGDLDLYVTNYFLESDEFYRNNGDGTFTDVIAQLAIDRCNTGSNHGTGVDFGDYNNDGHFDLLLPQFSHPAFALQYDHRNTTIYRNSGPPGYSFTDLNPGNEMIIPPSGLQFEETYAGGTWGDVNNDGLLDIYMTVFYGCRYVKLYLQNPDHTFTLKTFEYGLQKLNTGEDATWVDWDNDGWLDLSSGDQGRFRLFSNLTEGPNRYLSMDLKASNGNRFAIGAKVTVYCGTEKITRQVSAGRGVRNQAPYRLHFGIGNRSIDRVEILWPDGSSESYTGWIANKHYTVEQGKPIQGLSETDLDILLFGNPGAGLAFEVSTRKAGPLKVELVDMTGRVVETFFNGQTEPGVLSFSKDLSGLCHGMYYIKATSGKKVVAKKWIY